MATLPDKMRALQIDTYHENATESIKGLHLITKPIPKYSSGEVLIKVEATPCNPSDLLFLQGLYGIKKALPAVPGLEGAGIVVASGGGMRGKWLVGKRVAFSVRNDKDGTWAEYSVADVRDCIVLKDNVTTEQGATLTINPLTALGLFDRALSGGHAAIIQTAAASQLGRMVLELANEHGLPIINLVRKKEQEDLLRGLGAKIVLNTESETFDNDLKSEAGRLHATIAFDAVGGNMTGRLLNNMPDHSKVLVYGALSGSACGEISPLGLIFQHKTVEGFHLSDWISSKWLWNLYQATNQVQKHLSSGAFHTVIREQVTLENVPKALESYSKEMTLGKILIKPSVT